MQPWSRKGHSRQFPQKVVSENINWLEYIKSEGPAEPPHTSTCRYVCISVSTIEVIGMHECVFVGTHKYTVDS